MTGLAVGARRREPELGLVQHRVVVVMLPKLNHSLATQKYVQVSSVINLNFHKKPSCTFAVFVPMMDFGEIHM